MARLKPRFNADVNRWWLCDAGRYGFGFVDAADRLLVPTRREGETTTAATWDEAIAAVAGALRRVPADEIGVIASPQMANEDLCGAAPRAGRLRAIRHVGFAVPPRTPGDEDDVPDPRRQEPERARRRADGPGRRRARDVWPRRAGGGSSCLWIFGHDLLASAWPEARSARGAPRRRDDRSSPAPNANRTSARATGCCRRRRGSSARGRTRTSRAASSGSARRWSRSARRWPSGRCWRRVLAALGEAPTATRAEHWFRYARRRRARLRGPQLPVDRRHRSRAHPRRPGALTIADLGIAFGRVAFVMLFVLNLGGLLDVGRAQAVGHHAGPDRRQPRLDLRVPADRPLPPAGRRDQDAHQGGLPAARADRILFPLAPFVSVFFALVAVRVDSLRRHAAPGRPRDPAAGGDAQRRRSSTSSRCSRSASTA